MFKCRICNKPDPEHIWYCEEHYRCEDCGTKENLMTRSNELTCDSCHAKRAKKQVEKFDGDTEFTQDITCPWCGHKHMDSWEASDSDEWDCDNCGNTYSHVRDIEVSYSTSKC